MLFLIWQKMNDASYNNQCPRNFTCYDNSLNCVNLYIRLLVQVSKVDMDVAPRGGYLTFGEALNVL
jgi:hypothetical protein